MSRLPRSTALVSSDLAFTPAVKAVQARRGSRVPDAFEGALSTEVTAFLEGASTAFLATASASGQPYVQHRGGAPGFLRVLDPHTVAFADLRGNRQYISLGNLSENPRAMLLVMDYQQRQRVKVWGTARVIEGDAALEEKLRDPAYPGRVERVILFSVAAWDVNCQQHIHERYSRRQIAPVVEGLHKRIAELEAEVERLRTISSPARQHEPGATS